MTGIQVSLYFRDGSFFQCVDGVETKLDPWLGVQLEEWCQRPKDWTRIGIGVYHPNDLWRHLTKGQEDRSAGST